jgi:uncharacterized Ntn-hydrolase superfamily protein
MTKVMFRDIRSLSCEDGKYKRSPNRKSAVMRLNQGERLLENFVDDRTDDPNCSVNRLELLANFWQIAFLEEAP